MALPPPNYLLLSLPSFRHLILSEYPPIPGIVQVPGTWDMSDATPSSEGAGAEGSDGCEDDTAKSEVCTGVWVTTQSSLGGESEGHAGVEPREVRRPSVAEKDAAVKGEVEAWRLLVLQSGWCPGTGMSGGTE